MLMETFHETALHVGKGVAVKIFYKEMKELITHHSKIWELVNVAKSLDILSESNLADLLRNHGHGSQAKVVANWRYVLGSMSDPESRIKKKQELLRSPRVINRFSVWKQSELDYIRNDLALDIFNDIVYDEFTFKVRPLIFSS